MSRSRRLFLGTLVCLSISACSFLRAAVPVLADVAVVVADAQQILDIIDKIAQAFFAKNDVPWRWQYDEAFKRCELTLNAALRLCEGAQDLSDDQADKAFTDFRAAYAALSQLLQTYGMMLPDGALKASPQSAAGIVLPKPLVMERKVVVRR